MPCLRRGTVQSKTVSRSSRSTGAFRSGARNQLAYLRDQLAYLYSGAALSAAASVFIVACHFLPAES